MSELASLPVGQFQLEDFQAKAGFTLTPLQLKDAYQFAEWRRSLNTYEVGGGKTVVSTVVSMLNNTELTIIIVPPILLLSWERWLKKFSDKVLRYQGTPKERKLMKLAEYRWVLASHAIFRKEIKHIYMQVRHLNYDLIVDEAQVIKSPESKIYQYVRDFTEDKPLQLLTGTPTSSPLDAYSYISLKTPGVYRGYENFLMCHVGERDFFGAVSEYHNLDKLAERFAMHTIKRDKQEIHGYNNEPLYPDTHYELEKDHYALYVELVEQQLLLLDDGSKIDGTVATRLYHLLQQIVINYDHFSGDPTKRSAAYDLIDQTIESTDCLNPDKSKLIIWTHYKLTSRSVLRYLNNLKYGAVGAYSEVNSAKSFELFLNDPKTRILVANQQSAGAGLNPQEVCSEALFLEVSTRPMLTRQSLGRLDRVGQKRKPVQRMATAVGTIQEELLKKLLSNDDLVARVERTKFSLREILLGGTT